MKRIASILAVISMLLPQIGGAVDFAFQPRLETGVMYYKFDQDDSSLVTQFFGSGTTSTDIEEGLEFEDTLPFISGALTVFADNFCRS